MRQIALIKTSWKFWATGLLIGALVGVLIASVYPKRYVASSTLFVGYDTSGQDAQQTYQASLYVQQRLNSYVQLTETDQVAARVAELEPEQLSKNDIRDRLQTTVIPNTVLLRVSATESDPGKARDLSVAGAKALSQEIVALERNGQVAGAVQVSVVTSAALPTGPASPSRWRIVIAAALLGLFFGAAVGFAFHALRRPDTADGAANSAFAQAP